MSRHRSIYPRFCPLQLDDQHHWITRTIAVARPFFPLTPFIHVPRLTTHASALNLEYISRRDSMDEVLVYSPRHPIDPHATLPPSSRLSTILSTDSTTVSHTDQQFLYYTFTLPTILRSQRDTCHPSIPSSNRLILTLFCPLSEHHSTNRHTNSEHNSPH